MRHRNGAEVQGHGSVSRHLALRPPKTRAVDFINMAATPERPKAIACTVAVAFILATSRWGSNIGAYPIFLTDVLIALALFVLATSNRREAGNKQERWAARRPAGTVLGLFLGYAVLRMIASFPREGGVTVWARDGAPYLYVGLACVSSFALYKSNSGQRQRTARVVWGALLAHLSWTAVVSILNLTDLPRPPLFGAPIFEVRPDIDVAILAVTAALALRRCILGIHRVYSAAIVIAALGAVMTFPTRAGLLSVLSSLALCFFLHYTGATSQRRTNMILAIPLLTIALVVALPMTTAGQRLIATVDPTQAITEAQFNAQGTERARNLVWSGVIAWVDDTPTRQLFGSGFGNDFLAESGTLRYLEGTDYTGVRSPHNWFVGTYARLGLIGVASAIAVVLHLLVTLARHRRRFGEEELLFLAGAVVVAILPVASLGVVLEAPFGAVPFWWCAGIVFAATALRTASGRGARNLRFGGAPPTEEAVPHHSKLQGQ